MQIININKSIPFVFAALFAFVASANELTFSTEVYENFHAGKTFPENIRDYIAAQDYRAALEFAERTLLQLDLSNSDPEEIYTAIKKASEILTKHASVDAIEPDDSWTRWVEMAFENYDTFEEFESNNPSRCDAGSQNFKRFISFATNGLGHFRPQIAETSFSELWLNSKNSMRPGKTLMGLANQNFAAVVVINALYCTKMSIVSEQSGSVLRTNKGIWVWSPAYSGEGMDRYRAKRLQENLGARYQSFMKEYNNAYINDRAWNYPGIVAYIPGLKDPKGALLGYIRDLQSQLKMSSSKEAAAFAHEFFVKQHFLKDGNGRMGRILANVILAQANEKPLIVTNDPCYTQATEKGFSDLLHFVDFMDNPACEQIKHDELK